MVVTDADFQAKVINFPGVTLVDFWAEWCHPCRIIKPYIEEIATEMAADKNVQILELDTDANPIISGQYGVLSIPTLLIFKGGMVKKQLIGVRPKDEIVEAIKTAQSE